MDAILIYADGGGRHPAIQPARTKLINDLIAKGVGVGCAHYGVEVPAGDTGKTMQDWIGGYYEHKFSVNPMWAPDFKTFPKQVFDLQVQAHVVSIQLHQGLLNLPNLTFCLLVLQ